MLQAARSAFRIAGSAVPQCRGPCERWARQGTRDAKEGAQSLEAAFVQARIQDAFGAFDGIMRIVAASATRAIDVRCVRCRAVSLDETMALGMIEAGQNGDAVNIHVYLDDWIPAAAARLALEPVLLVAELMDRAGMKLSGNRDRHIGLRFDHTLH